jgi:hypothetical protein
MSDEKIKEIIESNRRALVGFAHYDEGKKREGCDCCYCDPRGDEDER